MGLGHGWKKVLANRVDAPFAACGPQKVYPALIARFRPAMVHCFWPIFFCGSQGWLAQLLPPRRCIGVRTRQTDGTDGLEESSAWASLPQSQCSVVWSPRNFDNASRIRSFRSVRVFGNNANRVFESYVRARHQPRPVPKLGPLEFHHQISSLVTVFATGPRRVS